jgi:inner membrane protein
MMGRSHLALGIMSGVAAAKLAGVDMFTGLELTALAAISAVIPDLDSDGILTRRLTDRPLRLIRLVSGYTGVALILLSYFRHSHNMQFLTAFIGLLFLGVGFILQDNASRKWMVTLIGVLIMGAGVFQQLGEGVFALRHIPYEVLHSTSTWILVLGAFISIVPHFAHRTYSHTIWAVAAWGFVWYGAEKALHVHGLFLAGVAGYLSHLLADTLTVSGVRYLYPFPLHFKVPLIRTKKDSRKEMAVVTLSGVFVFLLCIDIFHIPQSVIELFL